MYSDLELKAFQVADNWLNVMAKGESAWLNTYPLGTEGEIAKNYIDEHKLASYRNPGSRTSLSDITPLGLKVVKMGGLQKYLDWLHESQKQKEQIQDELTKRELQKINLEIDDLVNKLVDYDKVKRQAKNSVRIAIISGVATVLSVIVAVIALLKK